MSRRYIYFGSFASVQFFSDLFGMPAAAYSLRKLTTNATNCIRVRRSSDNTEQDIGFVANVPNSPIDTTALLAFVGAGNGFVTTWYDQSTNARDGLQSTGGNQPQIVSSGNVILENSLPFIEYTSTNKLLRTSANFSMFHPITALLVAKNTRAISAFPYYFDFQTNRTIFYYQNDVSPNGLSAFSGQQINSGNTSTALAYFEALYNSSSSVLRRNAVQIASGNTGTNGASGNLFIGSRNSSLQNLTGGFQELILYPQDQTSNRTAIETNINTYYNVF
jgi:hypothetical protein